MSRSGSLGGERVAGRKHSRSEVRFSGGKDYEDVSEDVCSWDCYRFFEWFMALSQSVSFALTGAEPESAAPASVRMFADP